MRAFIPRADDLGHGSRTGSILGGFTLGGDDSIQTGEAVAAVRHPWEQPTI